MVCPRRSWKSIGQSVVEHIEKWRRDFYACTYCIINKMTVVRGWMVNMTFITVHKSVIISIRLFILRPFDFILFLTLFVL